MRPGVTPTSLVESEETGHGGRKTPLFTRVLALSLALAACGPSEAHVDITPTQDAATADLGRPGSTDSAVGPPPADAHPPGASAADVPTPEDMQAAPSVADAEPPAAVSPCTGFTCPQTDALTQVCVEHTSADSTPSIRCVADLSGTGHIANHYQVEFTGLAGPGAGTEALTERLLELFNTRGYKLSLVVPDAADGSNGAPETFTVYLVQGVDAPMMRACRSGRD